MPEIPNGLSVDKKAFLKEVLSDPVIEMAATKASTAKIPWKSRVEIAAVVGVQPHHLIATNFIEFH